MNFPPAKRIVLKALRTRWVAEKNGFFAIVLALHDAPFAWHPKTVNLLMASYLFYDALESSLRYAAVVAVRVYCTLVICPQHAEPADAAQMKKRAQTDRCR
jgi:hypothetical protein